MKLFRTLSTTRLIALAVALVVVLAGSAVAVAASGGSGPTPPAEAARPGDPRRLVGARADRCHGAHQLHQQPLPVRRADRHDRHRADDRRQRPALAEPERRPDRAAVRRGRRPDRVGLRRRSPCTTRRPTPPTSPTCRRSTPRRRAPSTGPPSLDQISTFLTDLGKHWTVSDAQPSDVAGQAAYTVSVSPEPRRRPARLGRARLGRGAGRAAEDRDLRAGLSRACALALEVKQISFGSVSDSDIAIGVPAGAKTIDLSSNGDRHRARPDGSSSARHRAGSRAGSRAVHRRRARLARRPAAAGHPAGRRRRDRRPSSPSTARVSAPWS